MPVNKQPFRSAGVEPPRPYLNIIISNPDNGKSLKAYGLIDTGADECAFPAWMARALGHNLEAGLPKMVTTASGFATNFSHTTTIEIPGFSTNRVVVDFAPGLGVCLLGVRSFLSNFVLVLNYRKGFFSLKKDISPKEQIPLRLNLRKGSAQPPTPHPLPSSACSCGR
jgi:predicted aspartyl protease